MALRLQLVILASAFEADSTRCVIVMFDVLWLHAKCSLLYLSKHKHVGQRSGVAALDGLARHGTVWEWPVAHSRVTTSSQSQVGTVARHGSVKVDSKGVHAKQHRTTPTKTTAWHWMGSYSVQCTRFNAPEDDKSPQLVTCVV